MQQITLVWLRRDLRLDDQAALYYALKHHRNVLPLFIFDTDILDKLQDRQDRRVDFIYSVIAELKKELEAMGSALMVECGKPYTIFENLFKKYRIDAIYTNNDYEPYAIQRDSHIKDMAQQYGTAFHSFKDQCIFEKSEVIKDDGSAYNVFTPYSKKWKAKLSPFYIKSYPCEKYYTNFLKCQPFKLPDIETLGFQAVGDGFKKYKLSKDLIKNYHHTRDIPALRGTSRVGMHLRFGTISIRKLVSYAKDYNDTFLNELIWREFYMMILYHYPQVVNSAFKKVYDNIQWRNNEGEFEAWCTGKTGYPIVDAGMRELNATGFMHNRVRMIVASFLVKHLLVDWRWGEAYFAQKLNDYELSSNNGGWQWAASSGCDAVPYFRMFNPYEQAKRFDPDHTYIKKWVKELESPAYPKPIVDHKQARERMFKIYKAALTKE